MTIEEKKEFIKCAKSPVYFLNNYGYVFDITKQEVSRLKCFDFQEDLLNKYEKNKNNIILKARQMGASVITAGYVAWRMLFGIDERILVIANDGNGARRFLATMKQFFDNLPPFLLPDKIPTNNTQQIIFSNGSFCKAVASGENAGRGEALTLLIMDETAFIDNADKIWMAASLALSSKDAKCIMISTPFGTSGLYHATWVGAQKNENSFIPTEIHWGQHPVYSVGLEERFDEYGKKYRWSPWYEEKCKNFNYDRIKIAQELDLSFEGSSAVVIENYIIERYEKDCQGVKPICYYDFHEPESGFVLRETKFFVWEKPQPKANYILAADVARGDGSDFSTVQIINADTLVQVAEYQGKIPTDIFARLINKVAKEYNNAFVAIECNNFGLVTSIALKNHLKYDPSRIYHSKSIKKIYIRFPGFESVDANEEIPGFQTTTKTRPLLIGCLHKYMRDGQIKIYSKKLLDEFKTFIVNGEKVEHAHGYHDDLIFAFAIALLMRDTEFENVFRSQEMFKAMLDSIDHKTTNNENLNLEPQKEVKHNPNNDSDLGWLYGPMAG